MRSIAIWLLVGDFHLWEATKHGHVFHGTPPHGQERCNQSIVHMLFEYCGTIKDLEVFVYLISSFFHVNRL